VIGIKWVVPPVQLTAETKEEFIEMVQAALANSRSDLVVDLEAVKEIDSLGLGALVAAHRDVHYQGGHLILYAPDHPLYERLQKTRLTRLMPVYESYSTLLAEHLHWRSWLAAS